LTSAGKLGFSESDDDAPISRGKPLSGLKRRNELRKFSVVIIK